MWYEQISNTITCFCRHVARRNCVNSLAILLSSVCRAEYLLICVAMAAKFSSYTVTIKLIYLSVINKVQV